MTGLPQTSLKAGTVAWKISASARALQSVLLTAWPFFTLIWDPHQILKSSAKIAFCQSDFKMFLLNIVPWERSIQVSSELVDRKDIVKPQMFFECNRISNREEFMLQQLCEAWGNMMQQLILIMSWCPDGLRHVLCNYNVLCVSSDPCFMSCQFLFKSS